jgi:hypothetical protein
MGQDWTDWTAKSEVVHGMYPLMISTAEKWIAWLVTRIFPRELGFGIEVENY